MRSIFLKFLWEMPEALMADFTEFPRIRIPWDWYTDVYKRQVLGRLNAWTQRWIWQRDMALIPPIMTDM